MNSYVIGMLRAGLWLKVHFNTVVELSVKFACVSGSYALYDNTNWIRAGESEDKACTSSSFRYCKIRYGKSSGEMTQGGRCTCNAT